MGLYGRYMQNYSIEKNENYLHVGNHRSQILQTPLLQFLAKPNHQQLQKRKPQKTSLNPYFPLMISPPYSDQPYAVVNDNVPYFSASDLTTEAFEVYSNLDDLGRCGVAYANICTDIMPTEERGEIGQVKPSGWHTVKYNDIIDGNYLYNRCHLIGYQLAGENANVQNLITGTRYLNIQGMLPFETQVADYVYVYNIQPGIAIDYFIIRLVPA